MTLYGKRGLLLAAAAFIFSASAARAGTWDDSAGTFSVGITTFSISDGKVGVNTTSPGASLEVAGSGAKFSGTLATESPADSNLYAGILSGTPRLIFGGSTVREMDNSGGTLRFFHPGVLDMQLDASGNLQVNGTLKTATGYAFKLIAGSGSVSINCTGVGGCATTSSITFGYTFTSAPLVFLTSTAPQAAWLDVLLPHITATTTTGATVNFSNPTTNNANGTMSYNWIAIGN